MKLFTATLRFDRLRLLVGSALLAMILLALSAPLTARAHDQLVETNPAADAQLDGAPESIELVYSNSLVTVGNIVEVINAAGENIVEQELTVSGPKLVQPLPSNLADGWYLVNWRAVSSDGHPITGHFYFLIGDDASVAKPAENPEYSDHHHDGESTTADEDESANPVIIYGALLVAGIGVGFGMYWYERSKKNKKNQQS